MDINIDKDKNNNNGNINSNSTNNTIASSGLFKWTLDALFNKGLSPSKKYKQQQNQSNDYISNNDKHNNKNANKTIIDELDENLFKNLNYHTNYTSNDSNNIPNKVRMRSNSFDSTFYRKYDLLPDITQTDYQSNIKDINMPNMDHSTRLKSPVPLYPQNATDLKKKLNNDEDLINPTNTFEFEKILFENKLKQRKQEEENVIEISNKPNSKLRYANNFQNLSNKNNSLDPLQNYTLENNKDTINYSNNAKLNLGIKQYENHSINIPGKFPKTDKSNDQKIHNNNNNDNNNNNNNNELEIDMIKLMDQNKENHRDINNNLIHFFQQLNINNDNLHFINENLSNLVTENDKLMKDNNFLKVELLHELKQNKFITDNLIKVSNKYNDLKNVTNDIVNVNNKLEKLNLDQKNKLIENDDKINKLNDYNYQLELQINNLNIKLDQYKFDIDNLNSENLRLNDKLIEQENFYQFKLEDNYNILNGNI